MIVKVKKTHQNAILPRYAKQGDAGQDLTVTEVEYLDSEHIKLHFGLAFEIPTGYVGYIFPRSSCYKQKQILSNSVGVVDSGYRGEVSAVMIGTSKDFMYRVGDRAAQIIIMPIPTIEFEEVQELSESERGDSGYGSSGNTNAVTKFEAGKYYMPFEDYVMYGGVVGFKKSVVYDCVEDDTLDSEVSTEHAMKGEEHLFKQV